MVSEEKMFENVNGRTTDDGRTDAGVTGILLAHPSGSGEDFKKFLPYMGVAAIFVMLKS